MQDQKFYITTPIYYGNGVPHIWHTYSSLIANVIYKYNKIAGKKLRFTTWIDENSQKAVLKAKEAGKEIMEYLDEMAQKHKSVWDFFNIEYTDFIRTTENRHHKLVQAVLQTCYERGDIYAGMYEGMYCVGCESFKKDEDLIERDGKKVCPDHLVEPQKLKEKNYFFKLSKYQTWIEEFYAKNPDFVKPDFRYNEVKAFVKRWLEDFSISRETNTFGIPVPFDNSQVTYVWFDALFNYYTSCKYSKSGDKNSENFSDEAKEFWEENPNKVHVVGKDIIRFHAIFWPCMLASYFNLGEEKNWVIHYKNSDRIFLPTTILTGWYFTVDGQKMSKSLWNVIEPVEYAKQYGKELLTLYMLSAFPIGTDGDYDREQALLTYNAKLANNLWNLVNRVVVLALKLDWKLQKPSEFEIQTYAEVEDGAYFGNPMDTLSYFQNDFYDAIWLYQLKNSLDYAFAYLTNLNKFADEQEPWKTIKDETKLVETKEVLYILAEWLRQVWLTLYPFFPEKMAEMFAKLGLENYTESLERGELQKLIDKSETFVIKEKGEPLFLRFEI